ncbi:hypothetical protein CULT_690047 [[Clostridium] ultunense Esp]|nr:hypothetical protein CULT_690047 [[Clostridium] ultunense Esp]
MELIHAFIASMGHYLEMRGFILNPSPRMETNPQQKENLIREERKLLESIGERLARFHRASAGFPVSRRHPLNRIGKWREIWVERLKRIRRFRDALFSQGISNELESLFLDNYTYYHQLAQDALFYLDDYHYPEVVPLSAAYGVLSYRSLSLDQLEIKGESIGFRHAEDWRLDIPVRDLGHFMRNTFMEKGEPAGAFSFLQGYQRVREILPEEFPLLYAILLFPYEWAGYVEGYYAKNLEPGLGELKFRSLLNQEAQKNRFLIQFREKLKEWSGVDLAEIEWLKPTHLREPRESP